MDVVPEEPAVVREPGLMETSVKAFSPHPKRPLWMNLNHHLGKICKGKSSICFLFFGFFLSFQEIAQLRGSVF